MFSRSLLCVFSLLLLITCLSASVQACPVQLATGQIVELSGVAYGAVLPQFARLPDGSLVAIAGPAYSNYLGLNLATPFVPQPTVILGTPFFRDQFFLRDHLFFGNNGVFFHDEPIRRFFPRRSR